MHQSVNILPDSRLRDPKNVQRFQQNRTVSNWVPIFCANCGKSGGHVPEENCNFAFYLCNDCVETWGAVAGTHCVPDDVFWQKVRDAQQEAYGRQLNAFEIDEALKDEHNVLSRLVRERPK